MIWAEKKNDCGEYKNRLKQTKMNKRDNIIIYVVLISCLITAFLLLFFTVLFFTRDLKQEAVELRAEHEAIEEHYCPYCGTYLGDKNVDNN